MIKYRQAGQLVACIFPFSIYIDHSISLLSFFIHVHSSFTHSIFVTLSFVVSQLASMLLFCQACIRCSHLLSLSVLCVKMVNRNQE